MYPYINIWDLTLSMTGIWIVVSFFVFMLVIYIRTNQEKLKFSKFFSIVILLILLAHILWKYFHLLFEYKIYFPINYKEIMFFLPNVSWFKYSFVWILIACFLFFWYFLKYRTNKLLRPKRVNIIFQALTISFIPLGLFLLLGDDFIGKNTNSFLSVHPLTNETKLSAFDNIYPVGLFLSIWSFFTIIIKRFIDKQTNKKNWYLWLGIFLIMLSIVFLFQKYTRHIVDPLWFSKGSSKILVMIFSTIDVKQYVLGLLWLFMIYLWQKDFKKNT